MALEKDKTADDIGSEPNGVELLLQKREIEKDNDSFLKSQPLIFICAVSLAIGMLIAAYFLSSASMVQSVSVTGCNYLSRSYVQKISGVTLNSRYYLTLPTTVANHLEKDPMISNAHVEMRNSNVIELIIEEKQPVGYRYEDDTAYIVMSNGSKAALTSEYMSVISRVPYIVGFNNDTQTHLLTKALGGIDKTIMEEIAQINQYSLNYDDQALEIQMRDGTYFFASYYNLDALNKYHELYSKMSEKGNCLYATEGQVVYYSACPWNEVQAELDYWKNDDGTYVINKYGDKVVKHYYTDNEGEKYLDENENPILIPIDASGNEVKDADFQANYDAGYYASGVLNIPEPDPSASAEAAVSDETQG
ncbi:MAG: FtsQ-type POTRA domain-containing protein [Erysipelotrichia bacterium]|nr:FtsQ-type POTRA domain-containing protein [Erysipelotrichia bacterium]